jgi:ribosomal protein S18 acetylase RimI-like enzyme
VIHYRTFRNTDPPLLAQLWNACFTERGAVVFRGTTLMEYFLYAKPYFDPAGLIQACAGEEMVGFVLAAFGPNADGSALNPETGMICLLGVHPGHRRQGIGTELLRRAEEYLAGHGARELYAGPLGNFSPFGFGLYGGSQSPGFLESETLSRPFFEARGYKVHKTCQVLQRPLDMPIVVSDGRFAAHRQRFEIHAGPYHDATWWQECVLGPVELHDFRMRDKNTHRVLARANLWEMETFNTRWNEHAIGFLDLEVAADSRRQGLARFLLAQLLRHLQDQFFSLVEFQVLDDNLPCQQLLRGLGFQQVDVGRHYRKEG